MTLISLEDAKTEVRKVVTDLKTRCEINYRLNSLPSIEFEEYLKKTEPQTDVATYKFIEWENGERTCKRDGDDYCKDEPQTEQAVFSKAILTSNNGVVKVEPQTEYDDKYREKIRPHDPHINWFEDEPQTERSE